MAQNDLLSLPAAAVGLTPASAASAWGFGSWVVLSASLPSNIYILGFEFMLTDQGSLDQTDEQFFEIGTGAGGAETTQIQIPVSMRPDTRVGHYMVKTQPVFFPEPYTVTQGTRLAVRVADSLASAITYNGVKIFYREGVTTITNMQSLMMLGCGA